MNSSVWCDSKEARGPQRLSSDTSGMLRVSYWERVAGDTKGTAEKEVGCMGCITWPHFTGHKWPLSLFSSCVQLACSLCHLSFSPLSKGPSLSQDLRCVWDGFRPKKVWVRAALCWPPLETACLASRDCPTSSPSQPQHMVLWLSVWSYWTKFELHDLENFSRIQIQCPFPSIPELLLHTLVHEASWSPPLLASFLQTLCRKLLLYSKLKTPSGFNSSSAEISTRSKANVQLGLESEHTCVEPALVVKGSHIPVFLISNLTSRAPEWPHCAAWQSPSERRGTTVG